MRLLRFNKDELYLGTVKDIVSIVHKEQINGANDLTLTTTHPMAKNDRLVYQDEKGMWSEFIVRGIEEYRKGLKILSEVFAEHSISETLGDYIQDDYVTDGSALSALTKALIPTRWTVGTVNVGGSKSVHFYNTNSRKAITDTVETWGGELQYRIQVTDHRITGRFVDLVVERGIQLDRRFTYNKNLENVKKITHDDDVITALYGFGKGEEVIQGGRKFTKRLDFSSINGGKAYVENVTAKNEWGRLDGVSKKHVFAKVEFDDVEKREELLELTQKKLEEVSKLKVTYEASIYNFPWVNSIDLNLCLGDTVQIIDTEFTPELRLSARVIEFERNPILPETSNIVLGTFKPMISDVIQTQSKQINMLRDRPEGVAPSSIIPVISGQLGPVSYIKGPTLIPFSEFWVTQGVNYNANTRRFTVLEEGIYRLTLNAFKATGPTAVRVLVGVNTDTPSPGAHKGHCYTSSSGYSTTSLNSVVYLKENDFVVFYLLEGILHNTSNDRFTQFSIQKIGS